MVNLFTRQIANLLTSVRLLLAVPICLLIVNEYYSVVLLLAFIAAISDALDGYFARKFKAISYYGAVVDPLADKTLIVSTYIALAVIGLIPIWLVGIVLTRDMVIVSGALIYRLRYGYYKMQPSVYGKISTAVQIGYALLLLSEQVYPFLPTLSLQLMMWLVIAFTVLSGGHYLFIWINRIWAPDLSR